MVVLVFSLSLSARPNKHSQTMPAIDPAYVSALSTADRFLHAWQTGDLETGMVLLSDRVRHSQDPEKLEEYFSTRNERGFEITRGRSERRHYRFPVVLVTNSSGHARRRFSEIVMVNTGKNEWVVDKLP